MKKTTIKLMTFILITLFLLAGSVLAAQEDFTTWTEVDPDSNISVNSTTVSWTDIRHDYDEHVYTDLGSSVNYTMTANFTLLMTTDCTNAGEVGYFGIADDLDSIYDMILDDDDFVFVVTRQVAAPSPYYRACLYKSDSVGDDRSSEIAISRGTTYYVTFKYNQSAGSHGAAYLYIYTDAARETLLGATSLAFEDDIQYRYIYALDSYKNPALGGGSYKHYGSTGYLTMTNAVAPSITTGNATGIKYLPALGWWQATLSANVTNDGEEEPTVSFYIRENPAGDWYWSNATGTYATGETANVTISEYAPGVGLEPGVTYDYFARASNSAGYSDGATANFTVTETGIAPEILTLAYPISINTVNLTATIYGQIEYDGAANVSAWFYWREYGAGSWNATANTTDLVTNDLFSANLTGLTLNTVYQFQAAGTNEYGTGYGGIADFTLTNVYTPVVETVGHQFVTDSTAYLTGNVTDMGGDDYLEVWFQYREVGDHVWLNTNRSTVNETKTYTLQLTGLSPTTNYEYRAIARAAILGGASDYYGYGDILAFNTQTQYSIPVMITGNATYVSEGYVRLLSEVEYDGGSVVTVYAQYRVGGTSTWSSTPVTHGAETGDEVWQYASGLVNNVTYEYRAVGTNEYGTGYGSIREFYLTSSTVTGGGEGEGDTTPATGNALIDWLRDWQETLGLTGAFGDWAFMALIMALVCLPFVIGIVLMPEDYLKKVITVILVVIETCIFGAFIFSGWVNIWAVVILIFVATSLAILIITRLMR